MRKLTAGLGLLVVASPMAAWAAETVAVELEYEASPSCPGRVEFERQLRARLRQGRIAEPDEGARVLRVGLTSDGELARARLEIQGPEGALTLRELTAESCEELVEAMALVAALTIEALGDEESPAHFAEPASPPAPPPWSPRPQLSQPTPTSRPDVHVDTSPGLPTPLPPAPSSGSASSSPRRSAPPSPPDALPVQSAAPAPAAPTPDFQPWVPVALSMPQGRASARFSLGLRLVAESAVAPKPLFGGEIALGWDVGSFETRGSARWLGGAAQEFGPGQARFRLMGGGFAVCAFPLPILPRLDLGGCGGLELGALRAEGLRGGEIVEGRAATRLWAAGRLLGEMRFWSGSFGAELSGGAVLPFAREVFVFDSPERVIHETPAIGAVLEAGLSWRLP